MIKLKRARDPAARSDGYRVLVERLWPRGIRKQSLAIDEWLKEIAPSTELRTWFGHDPERWPEFQRRYRRELQHEPARGRLRELVDRAAHGTVTLIFSTHDPEHNNAVMLKDEIARRRTMRGPRAPRSHARPARGRGARFGAGASSGDDARSSSTKRAKGMRDSASRR
jgi:uncharacterized protein YeaO (DUF488 family)